MSERLDPALVDQLARMTDDQRREAVLAASAERQRRIRGVVNQVRRSMLPNVSRRRAAREIAAAAHGRCVATDPAVRADIEAALVDQLGSIADVPDADRIRQLFE